MKISAKLIVNNTNFYTFVSPYIEIYF